VTTQAGVETADVHAREIEQQLTDEERFALVIAPLRALAGGLNPHVDPRIPADLPMRAGYTPGVPRLGATPTWWCRAARRSPPASP
jgi:beta-glucosidase